ncbi:MULTISPECIES: hypothetical protein [Bacillus]|uniref:Lipoprotein n=2 Tax=Bacillus cereus group TaxID=86661 RepID=A0AAP7W9C2_BACMY|nr:MULTISPECIES: hypothetical protein [Bacillus cereus group]AJH21735.1 hypothetical protein BG05_2681 [Bacillus mycoides]EEL98543.1 hypothetical protein bmyco0001_29750 [Bacillus mycoides DSM 2048]EJS05791.1 hypothetical protein IKM_02220 [Bacillus mycoides]EOO38538.1 lipoprotein [Bacillus mycoides]ETT79434.1 hypothetical protein C174_09272 [Bacillus mycoides FSL H7-687]
MKMKKVAIASVAIGTMLTMAACSTSTDKDAAKKDQATAQNEEQSKTTSADEASKTTKDTEKDTNTSSNEKTDKDAKNTKESSGTESNGKTTKEKETTGKTNDQTTSGKTTDQSTSTNNNGKTTDQSTSTNNNGKTTKDPKKSVAVKTNVKEVVTLIESLDKQLAANPKLETVNKLGKQINEKWDVIEKELEASHPTEYKTIGQSMYPLIVGAEKEKIDINKMKSLTTKTKKDLNQLLTKLS